MTHSLSHGTYEKFIGAAKGLTPARKAALCPLLFREYGFLPASILDHVLSGEGEACTLLNAYSLNSVASGAERINYHRAIKQMERNVLGN